MLVRVLISLVSHLRRGKIVALFKGLRVWLYLIERVLIKGILSVLPLPQPSNWLVLESEVRVIRVMMLTVGRIWLESPTPTSDDRAVILLPLTVTGKTHIITIANLCLLLLQIILRVGRI